ncbi:phosphoethanolamine transferase [Vibrio algivorus]|uniref:Phosphoethanolamine--lipid A transferase n=1 Tax=Vibrio algivorus TaxID=1667024 RepID=A0A557NYU9_9VIBR|nr:phosphoethanolamine--lipid A transferase [Vibrio algivorus]TVO33591.1 phosphoethanolamine--lipid A transferase [Vibrio algivorus]
MKKSSSLGNLSLFNITILLAAFFALVINMPVYFKVYKIMLEEGYVNWFFLVSIPFFLFSCLTIIFNVFTFPYMIKVVFVPVVLISSIVSYSSFTYGVFFDVDMIRNIFQTDKSEAFSYFNWPFFIWFISFGIIPSLILLFVNIKKERSLWFVILDKLKLLVFSIVVIFFITIFFYKDYVSIGRNNSYLKRMIIPNEFIYSTYKYIKHEYFSYPIVYREIGLDAKVTNNNLYHKPKLLIMVVGETARAQNYPTNGYSRNTTPYTEKKSVYSFKNVSSCGTATAISVPCMFSALNRNNYDHDIANNQDNVLDILNRVGIDVLWKDNDGGDKDVAKNINKVMISRDSDNDLCDGSTCFDEILIKDLKKDIKQKDQVIILHIIGSHGPTYFKRYPKMEREFSPVCNRSDIENCSKQQIINTYDNTIMYTDLFLSKIIDILSDEKDHDTALFYISDHGESLGENGIYLHGMPYAIAPEYQKTVPMMLWMSSSFKQGMSLNENCMKKLQKRNDLSQDYVFHSLLGAMNVKTEVYKESLDLFYQCKKQ